MPLVLAGRDAVPAGTQVTQTPVSGIDVAPTLCDFAGIPAPPNARGQSLRPLLGDNRCAGRGFAVAESFVYGRMVRTADHKFITYRSVAGTSA